ncbi:MAG: hypothetical protein IJL03_09405 [Lachnospiraceae bacterium]|nr:hypothetical protein [Lachnospiraceae bacterium]
MKEVFEKAELTVVMICTADVITQSSNDPWNHGGGGSQTEEPTPEAGGNG